MSRLTSITSSIALIGAGMLAWGASALPLINNPELAAPVNPLGIKRSPYGEVIAMALQGPIDKYFDAGMANGSPSHQEGKQRGPDSTNETSPTSSTRSLSARFEALLTSLNQAAETRTNPKTASPALKRHLRRQAEDKLRFANQLDPAHYANYNSLHFFLTEPAVGTRPELTPSAAKLAADTIEYCLKQDHDPRPALTAAAAATNILQLMFDDQRNPTPKYNTGQMHQYLDLLDHCIARYNMIAREWEQSKHWDLLSSQRIAECEERLIFIEKIRDIAAATILRLEHNPRPSKASN